MAATPRYSDLITRLREGGVPLRELSGPGKVAVISPGARIIGFAFGDDEPNLFWTNPELGDTGPIGLGWTDYSCGLGGERLWLGKELSYFWKGTPDWAELSNYEVLTATDPGAYAFVGDEDTAIHLRADVELTTWDGEGPLRFRVDRVVRNAEAPLDADDAGVDYLGIETSHTVTLADSSREGRVDLWRLLQVPPGSVLVVPTRSAAPADVAAPLPYGRPGEWTQDDGCVLWFYGGEAQTKLGMSARALTGRNGVLRRLGDDDWCLLVRDIALRPDAAYVDHPDGIPRDDQALQAWDGLGFGEFEHRSPLLDAASGPRVLEETDRLWALRGGFDRIREVGRQLLDIDLTRARELAEGPL